MQAKAGTAGGPPSDVGSWARNPQVLLSIGTDASPPDALGAQSSSEVLPVCASGAPAATLYVEVSQRDPRLKYGKLLDKYMLPIGLHVCDGLLGS